MNGKWVVAGAICAIVGALGICLWLALPHMAAGSVPAPVTGAVQTRPAPTPTAQAPTPTTTVTLQLSDGLALALPAGWWSETGMVASRKLGPAGEGELLLSAWAGGDSFAVAPIRMTATRVHRHGIPLPRYVEDAGTLLAQTPGITVEMTSTTAALRADGLPAGELVFVSGAKGPLLRGYQVVLIDPPGENLVIVSFAALDVDFAARLGQFRAIVRSMHWG